MSLQNTFAAVTLTSLLALPLLGLLALNSACERQNTTAAPQEPAQAVTAADDTATATAADDMQADGSAAPLPPQDPNNQRSRPGIGTATLGQPCTADKRCAINLGCSGLFFDVSGTCIEATKAEDACKAAGGQWGPWGMGGFVYCNRKLPDGGKPCKTSADCSTKCVVLGDSAPQCQPFENQYGCYGIIDANGKKNTLCVD